MEDKLGHDERLRLECLAQAIAYRTHRQLTESPEQTIQRATEFEQYVARGK